LPWLQSRIALFEPETDMSDEPRERELSMDELDRVDGTGPIVPMAQHLRQITPQTAAARQGVCDDSV
jgi:hypothetical protein